MNLQDINKSEEIIQESYMHDGCFLETLWAEIYNANRHFSLQETFDALVIILRFMVDNGIVELMRWDNQKQEVITWSGEGEDVLAELREYLRPFTDKKVNKNPAFLDMFRFPGFRWKVPYPLDKTKYGLGQR